MICKVDELRAFGTVFLRFFSIEEIRHFCCILLFLLHRSREWGHCQPRPLQTLVVDIILLSLSTVVIEILLYKSTASSKVKRRMRCDNDARESCHVNEASGVDDAPILSLHLHPLHRHFIMQFQDQDPLRLAFA
jgi:hypothetical protein